MRRLLLASLLIFFCEAGSKQNDLIEMCVGESLLLDCPAGQVATGQLVGVQDSSCNCTCPGIRCNTDHDLKHIAKKCLWKSSSCQLQSFGSRRLKIGCPSGVNVKGFQCMPQENIYDICSKSSHIRLKPDSSGFIHSPNYPGAVSESVKPCSVVIEGPQGLGVHLNLLHMDLDSECSGYVQFESNLSHNKSIQGEKLCGFEDKNIQYSETLRGPVRVSFVTSGHSFVPPLTGFLLEYSINKNIPPLPLLSPSPSTPSSPSKTKR
ncbi:hypothetical protein CAPTEDRAFT_229234, partial [Capitella teleta]